MTDYERQGTAHDPDARGYERQGRREVPTTGWTAKAFLIAGVVVLAVLLASCAGPDKLTPAQSLFNIQEKYTEAGKLVLTYVTLPDCAEVEWPGMIRLCSDAEIRSALVDADREIWLILKAYEASRSHDPNIAEPYRQLAATALRSLTTLLAQHALTR